jgi:hypothetical protein
MQTKLSNFIISQMTQKEVQEIAIQWAKEEGWNPGLEDAQTFYAQDPQGFFVGKLNNQPIGCCSAVIYDKNFAFFGFYIVRKEWRKQGYGIEMTRHRLQYVGNRNIGLDGVLNMTDKYANLGFRPAHMNMRFQGQIAVKEQKDPHITRITETLIPQIEQYDLMYFPAPRKAFLKEWVKQSPNKKALVYLKKGEVKGYGVIRRCFAGFKIGPLFAESFEIAEMLFQSLVIEANGGDVFLDIPEPNEAALKLVEFYKMKESFKTMRMYTRGVPAINLNHVFGITTFELG